MLRVIFIALLLCCAIAASAQVITIKDQHTGEPLELVTLYSQQPHATAKTNAVGQTDISAFKGSEKIQVYLFGYESITTGYEQLDSAAFLLELKPEGLHLDEVVISATRWSQTTKDIPSRVISISPKEIAIQNPQTAADLLGASGEVFIQKSQQGGGSPMIRGFATNRLIYTVDGVRMNTAIFRGGNIQNVISLDPFATEKVEVFFGPGSVIYGSDAIGGVMSFQTLTPQLSLADRTLVSGKAVTRYSSANNERTGHFDVNVGWKKWAFVSSISANDYSDLRMGSHGPDEYLRPFYVQRQNGMDVIMANEDPRIQRPSGYSQVNMMQKVRFKPGDKLDLQYGFHYSETSDYARYDRHIRYRNGLPRYGKWSYGPQKWMMNNLNITHNGNNFLYDELSLRLAHQMFEESRIDRDINDPEQHTRIEEVTAYSANLDLTKTIGSKNTLFYGIEGVQNDVGSIGVDENILIGIKIPGSARYPQSTWASYAAYVSDQFKFSDKFLIQAGARYSLFMIDARFDSATLQAYPFPFSTASLNDDALTGSLGLVFNPSDKLTVFANAATGFRSPNVDDMGKVFDSEPGSVVVPNPDLESEYVYNADLGFTKVFGNALKFDLTGYYSVLQNALVRRDYTLNGMDSIVYDGTLSQVQAIQNAAMANVYGVQAGIELKLPAGFGFISRFNYQKGVEELDDGTSSPSRHAAPWYGLSKLTYTANKLSLQIYVMYNGEKKFEDMPEEEKGKPEIYAVDANGNPWSPGWYTLNFKALYQITEHFSVSSGLENITDIRYRPYSSGIVAPGRNFVLALRANF